MDPELLRYMRDAYLTGGNAMEASRRYLNSTANSLEAIEIAYDLQAGSYVRDATRNPLAHQLWTQQLADCLGGVLRRGDSMVEVGCGDGTTLGGVLGHLGAPGRIGAIDLSWSRTATARRYLAETGIRAELAVGDMMKLPLPDASVDVVFTSHAIEPNGGREFEAVSELLRVTRRYLVLFEPLFEFAGDEARDRMVSHGYVRGLLKAANMSTGTLIDAGPLPNWQNTLNPSGFIIVKSARESEGLGSNADTDAEISFACPLTGEVLVRGEDHLFAPKVGLAYPLIDGIPVLRPEFAVLASALGLVDTPNW